MARLSHPNVVAVHDAGAIDDRVFLAMEFVDGQTLARGSPPTPRGWRAIRDVFVAAGAGWRRRTPPGSCTATSSPRT